MKKYIQIAVVVGIFAILVVIRQLTEKHDESTITNQTQTTQPTTSQNSTSNTVITYKDGTYTGTVADAYYGNLQVKAIISGGKLTDVQFVEYPNDNNTTLKINQQAMPLLRSEAIQKQSAKVDIISSASQTSNAFKESLSSALQQAS